MRLNVAERISGAETRSSCAQVFCKRTDCRRGSRIERYRFAVWLRVEHNNRVNTIIDDAGRLNSVFALVGSNTN